MRAPVVHVLADAGLQAAGPVGQAELIVAEVAGRGWPTSVVFLDEGGPSEDRFRRLGASVVVAGRSLGERLRTVDAIRRLEPLLVHRHAGGRRFGWVLQRCTVAPVLGHVHGAIGESADSDMRDVAAHCDAIIVNSQAVARALRLEDATLVYPGIEMPETFPAAPRSDRQILGVAGRLTPIKGIDVLLHAFALVSESFPTAELHIAGTGPESSRLRELAQTLNVGDRVRFLGWVPDMMRCMATWDLYVQPSRYEGFGVAALEAMALARPLVVSDVGGLPELVGDVGWTVPPDDATALAAMIVQALSAPEERERRGRLGRERVRTDFSAARMTAAVLGLYQSLVRFDI